MKEGGQGHVGCRSLAQHQATGTSRLQTRVQGRQERLRRCAWWDRSGLVQNWWCFLWDRIV